ncbi:hypothetical protein ISF_04945 [Cordyceps fumosorosea ARSEF 2679]|uniref:Peptidyl-tRNA hydrolase n=1 Tax=Cordyceps fumosorosea (strain ARSEF 2679) TaxID=1081104 RepID=A0A167VWX3_CORFA|nr:hypothetical protein ISF_04945 [Cordyceps fumosorosea ARSEF 2679]OAA63069.1 hypothetical protein ISF_04945 [Cordyceps fumosorosea ARSEF 2679]
MRFSLATTALVAAVPALAADAVADGPLGQYKAQFQNFLGKFTGYVAESAVVQDGPVAAVEAKIGEAKISQLTLENWKDTLYAPVQAGSEIPEEWWVLITGRNKTCFGQCEKVEKAFNETAGRFTITPKAPHMAILNCEDERVLCNAWSAGVGSIWAFDMLPEPAAIDIYKRRLNMTTTTADDLVTLQAKGKKSFELLDSWFHPFNGKLAELGLSIPVGYAFWAFSLVPNWAFMLIVSMVSRTIMGNRMQPPQQRRAGATPGAGAAQ